MGYTSKVPKEYKHYNGTIEEMAQEMLSNESLQTEGYSVIGYAYEEVCKDLGIELERR